MKYLPFIFLLIVFGCNSKQAIVKLDNKYGVINENGDFLIQPIWDDIWWMSENIYPVRKDSLWGFMTRSGRIIINPKYAEVGFFNEGLAVVSNFDGKWGYVDKDGIEAIPLVYDYIFGDFHNGLSDFYIDEKCGYINKNNVVVIPATFEQCYPFISEVAQVYNEDEHSVSLINKKGDFIIDKGQYSDNQLWIPKNPYPYSIKNQTGQGRTNAIGDTIIPPIYEVTGNFMERRSIVKLNGKWGFYDDQGNLIQEPKFDDLQHFYEGLSLFKLNNKYGFIDKHGEIVIPAKFEKGNRFFNGLAEVQLNGKSGFINKKGEFVIEPRFEFSYSHFE